VRIRGLLFFHGSKFNMIARRITKQKKSNIISPGRVAAPGMGLPLIFLPWFVGRNKAVPGIAVALS
jgi:hypothetical protein